MTMARKILISVIVPSYQRVDQLQQCLDSLAPGTQTLRRQAYEVIVADDNPDEAIRQLVEPRYPWIRWHRAEHPSQGPAATRNAASIVARGAWLAFIDDDCVADANWLENIVDHINRGKVDLIEGRVVCHDKPLHPFFHCVENNQGEKYWTCNIAVRGDSFRQVGGFDERFRCGEDSDLAMRLLQANVRTVFAREVVVEHPAVRISPAEYLWRLIRAERWNTCLLAKHRFKDLPPGWQNLPQVSAHLVTDRCRGVWHLFSQPEHALIPEITKQLCLTLLYPAIFVYQLYWWRVFSGILKKGCKGRGCSFREN